MSAPANPAVFLSYASEDAAAARRICESLRAAGIEVWFDQSELVGGDTWDRKIRGQIATCALFVPVISAHTQARLEGYFRLEWKLAAQRTHTMADEKAFLLPVVIDATRDADATVPAEFKAVQWTRLPGGETSAAFCTRVRQLLGTPTDSAVGGALRPDSGAPSKSSGHKAPPTTARRVPTAAWAIGALAIAAVAVALFLTSQKPTTPNVATAPAISEKSIAVLPFENRSAEQDSAFFSEGVHEEILTNLAQVRELRVVSRTSVMEYRGTTKKMPQIARELGVAYLLEGSVQRAGGKVRVTGKLIRAATDESVWAQTYNDDLTDIFAIQAKLARAIADALQAKLSPQEHTLLARRPTENAEAYELYLKTRGADLATYFLRTTLEAHEGFLRAAVALDPKFAVAWAELAVRHSLFYYRNYDFTAARRAQAKTAIDNAVALAPDAPHVIRALGTYYLNVERDYAQAAAQFERLARAQPNDPETAAALGEAHQIQGRWTDAVASFRQATRLDPANVVFSSKLMLILYAGRRWDECETEGRRMLARRPQGSELGFWTSLIPFVRSGDTGPADAHFAALTPDQAAHSANVAARKFWMLIRGDYAGAIRLAEAHPINPSQTQDQWTIMTGTAFAYAAKGDLPAAQKLVTEIAPAYRRRVVDEPGNTDMLRTLGIIEALLGRKEEALHLARRAIEAVPANLDAVSHAASLNRLVIIYAWAGERDRAIEEAARMLRLPFTGVSVHMMKRDPFWFPLRGDPRFEALLDDPKNNAPLF